jgi:valyl-tRNA synthetase
MSCRAFDDVTRNTHPLFEIGCACDWERARFTLDEQLSDAVKEVFIHLYEKKLIYKGKYIVNWCPRCLTSLSDDEVEHRSSKSKLWYIKYKLKGQDQFLICATTRPETMLGDTALAVNPKDERYQKYIGKTAILPILDRELIIIADDYVDPEFGTGVVKITPAHDPNDFDMSQRHDLEKINILNPDGTITNAGKFKGLDRFVARKAVLEELEKKGLLERIEDYDLVAGACYRCNTVVEPYLSEQWFVRMKPLAKPAIEAVKSGKLSFHPEHWSKTYLYWMENIRDWCISRQLWWGHRIPVYYCQECNHEMVAKDAPESCAKCGATEIRQEEDVLDTWFSSWLWPFSTFGWPVQTDELKRFYPPAHLHRQRNHFSRLRVCDGRLRIHRQARLRRCLHSRNPPRLSRTQDVQVARQRHRSAGNYCQTWRRQSALIADPLHPRRTGSDDYDEYFRTGS